MILRRTPLVALLLAATACGGGGGGKDDDDKPDASANDGGGGGGSTDGGGGGSKDAGADATTATPPKPDQVTNTGADCTKQADCEGDNPTCLTSVSLVFDAIKFPGGYCSYACKSDIECGAGECPVATSLAALGDLAAGLDVNSLLPSHCYERCTDDNSCRTGEGYRCATILQALVDGAGAGGQLGLISGFLSGPIKDNKYCLPPAPPPPPMPEAGTPDAGTQPDAGTPDGGTPDSGTDAGAPDADTADV